MGGILQTLLSNLNYGTIKIKSIKDSYYISDFDVNPWDKKFYSIIPESVGQYTGLTDKNGKKIFEGDIVKTSHGGSTYYAKIEWDDGSFWVTNHDIQMPSYISEVSKTYLEVIGNIHDNPELLEVTE